MHELDAKPDIPNPKLGLLCRKGAAEYINATTRGAKSYTPKALANLASRGKGPPYLKLGNETYYLEQDINMWIWNKRIVPSSFYFETQTSKRLSTNTSEGE